MMLISSSALLYILFSLPPNTRAVTELYPPLPLFHISQIRSISIDAKASKRAAIHPDQDGINRPSQNGNLSRHLTLAHYRQ